jgi:glucose/arabinose dehydrogenase
MKKVILVVLFLLLCATPVSAITLPSGFTQTIVAEGLSLPTAIAFSPDGRIFVTEKNGKIKIIKNGQLLSTPFASISVDSGSERGLLGIAFDPDFTTNRYLYVYYSKGKNKVSRLTASASNPDVMESETILLDNITLDAGNHNAGTVMFGPDGKLYISTGDGGSNNQNAQNLGVLGGKILRLNKDGSIPSDNPFYNTPNARKEIWAYGLRNPFRFSFDSLTGKMYIGEVGQSTYEEINEGIAGRNYGWPTCEGACSNSAFTNPLHQYGRSVGTSVTGGVVYRGTQFPPQFRGKYFFGDYGANWIKMMDLSTNTVSNFATNAVTPVEFEVGPDESLYYTSIADGKIYKISYASAATSTPSNTPTNTLKPTPVIPVVCDADFNNDGKVDLIDYTILVYNFQKQPIPSPATDLNKDGVVNLFDYTYLVQFFTKKCAG